MTTDTSERGLERLICTTMTGHPCDSSQTVETHERPAAYGTGWVGGLPEDYDREYCADLAQLSAFLQETQPGVADTIDLGRDNPARRKFPAGPGPWWLPAALRGPSNIIMPSMLT